LPEMLLANIRRLFLPVLGSKSHIGARIVTGTLLGDDSDRVPDLPTLIGKSSWPVGTSLHLRAFAAFNWATVLASGLNSSRECC
jgi:hypothetical protein